MERWWEESVSNTQGQGRLLEGAGTERRSTRRAETKVSGEFSDTSAEVRREEGGGKRELVQEVSS